MDGAFPTQSDGGNYGPPSGGGGPPRGGGRGFRGTSENAKTRMCNRWLQGDCRFGDRCNFAHGDHELRGLPPRNQEGFQGGGYAPRGRGGMGYGGRSPGGRYGGGRGYGGGYAAPGGGYAAPGGYGMEGAQPVGGGGYGGGQAQQEMWPAPVEGPNGWLMYRVKDSNEPYFHNPRTGVTQWERPEGWNA